MSVIQSIDPTTGEAVLAGVAETSPAEVDAAVALAARAAPALDRLGRGFRAGLLRAIAARLEADAEEIVTTGMVETGLARPRLEGELRRTCYQARLFADALEEGGYLEAAIDHAGPTPMGPGPDLRRMLVPIGPVAVFGASNFPLAFSVPGGDTVAALAAGCPVVVKGHDSHPALSRLTFDLMSRAAAEVDAPEGTLGLVFGLAAGARLVAAPEVKAVGFTGSLSGGRALLGIINSRPEPIPFYGELSSLNPVVVTPGAAETRGTDLARAFVDSFTGSAGQLCTKPGVVFVPAGPAGDAFVAAAAESVADMPPFTVLNERIHGAFLEATRALPGRFEVVATGQQTGPGFAVPATLSQLPAEDLAGVDLEECFGPAAILVRYRPDELLPSLAGLAGSLTWTIHAEPAEQELAARLAQIGRAKAGRVLFSGWPTGVLVSWAQQHGGPWPATNSLHTSVGVTAIRRFLRPVTWQDAPPALLPVELTDDYDAIPRRVDGRLLPAAAPA